MRPDDGDNNRHYIDFKYRDKYSIKIGAGLILQNLEFKGGDSFNILNPTRDP